MTKRPIWSIQLVIHALSNKKAIYQEIAGKQYLIDPVKIMQTPFGELLQLCKEEKLFMEEKY